MPWLQLHRWSGSSPKSSGSRRNDPWWWNATSNPSSNRRSCGTKNRRSSRRIPRTKSTSRKSPRYAQSIQSTQSIELQSQEVRSTYDYIRQSGDEFERTSLFRDQHDERFVLSGQIRNVGIICLFWVFWFVTGRVCREAGDQWNDQERLRHLQTGGQEPEGRSHLADGGRPRRPRGREGGATGEGPREKERKARRKEKARRKGQTQRGGS